MPGCGSPIALGQVALSHRRDDRPMSAHRTTLEPPPAETKRLERDSRNPDRREEVAPSAADDQIGAKSIALPSGDDGAGDVEPGNGEGKPAPARRQPHDLSVAP